MRTGRRPPATPAPAVSAWLVFACAAAQVPLALAGTCALATLLLAFAWRAGPAVRATSRPMRLRDLPPAGSGVCTIGYGGAWLPAHSASLHAAADPGSGLARAPARRRDARVVQVDAGLLGRNVLALGSPGCGKTSLLVLLAWQAQRRGDALVVIDPKASRALRDSLAAGARAAGRLFLCLAPEDPMVATRYDPLRHCPDAAACADRLCGLLGEARQDPFRDFCRGVLATLCEALLAAGQRPALARLAALVPEAGERLLGGGGMPIAAASPSARLSRALAAVRALAGHDRTHYRKMCAPLLPMLELLSGGPRGRLLEAPAPGDAAVHLDLWHCRAQGATVYAGLDALAHPQFARALARLLIDDLAAQASHSWRHGLRQPVLQLMVDEAGEVACEPLLRLLGKGREAGIRVLVAMQTLADLEWRLESPAAARVALGNAGAWFLFRQLDAHSREESAARLGELPLLRLSIGRGLARSHGDGGRGRTATRSEQVTRLPAPRVPAATFAALRDGECLAHLPDGGLFHLAVPYRLDPGR